MKRILTAVAAVVAAAAAAAPDPLEKANAYTLELSPEMKESAYFFPIGVLGDRKFEILPFMGLNLTEMIHTCYEFREGKPCSCKRMGNGLGKFYYCHWAAHTLYRSRETKNYGTLKNLIRDDGTPGRNHMLSIADPKTRQYVLDVAASSTRNAVEQDGDNVFLWGIDNEYELAPDYSPESVALFRKWLENTYRGDLAKFHKAWGDGYQTFADAVPPKIAERNSRPGAWLDWRRFTEETFADFMRDYFAAIQNADPQKRPVVAKNTQCTLEMQAVARNRAVNHELIAEKTRDLSRGWYGFDQYGHGDRSVYEMNYFYHCIRPLEPKPGVRYGGFSAENNNHAGPGRQFAQTYFREIANGLHGVDFFVMGSVGAKDDYATFSFTDPDGTRRDRFFYLSRLAAMVHRTERFWSEAVPAEEITKVAMLVPQRDIMLAGDTGVSWWDYSTDNRLNVFARLRDAGYWVDAIPYGKLDAGYLKNYKALVLVGAEHLSKAECGAISGYVKNGGVLFADMRAGNFDEHHIESAGLAEVLGVSYKGVYTGIEVSPDDLWYHTKLGNVIRADGKILAALDTAKLVNEKDVFRNAKGAWITKNVFGKGQAYWFNTRLGALRPESVEMTVLTGWFADRMKEAGIEPSYSTVPDETGKLRVEQPLVDPAGDCVIAVTGTMMETLPPMELSLALPAGVKSASAWWGPAESTWLEPVAMKAGKGGQTVFSLPEIRSAGMLYLMPHYVPMLGLRVAGSGATAENDPYTAEFRPGDAFEVKVQVVNLADRKIPAGALTLQALGGWKVSGPAATPELGAGESREFTYTVAVPKQSPFFKPNAVYPLVATLALDGKRVAVANALVTLKVVAD